MKKLLPSLLALSLALGLTACGGSPAPSEPETPFEDLTPLTDQELDMLYTNPYDYKGSRVNLVGQVFAGVDRDEDGVYFQIYADPENLERNTYITCMNPDFQVEDDDYVAIDGMMYDVLESENMMGAELILPIVDVYTIDTLSYKDAMVPTLATAAAAQPTVDQHGYSVTVDNIELAEQETRVYVTVTNNGPECFNFWSYDAKIVQDGKQYEYTSNYEADYPKVQSEILPGVTSEGVLCFPALTGAPFQLLLEGRSDDYLQEFNPYAFDCAVQ